MRICFVICILFIASCGKQDNSAALPIPKPKVRVIGCSPETFWEHGHITVLYQNGQTRTIDTQDNEGPPCNSWNASPLWYIDGLDDGLLYGARVVKE